MSDAYTYFKYVLIVQLFFGFGYTMITTFAPNTTDTNLFGAVANSLTLEDVAGDSGQIQDTLQAQTDVPILSGASLVGLSAMLIVKLILNTFFAFPLMIGLLIEGSLFFLNLDPVLSSLLLQFIIGLASVLYVLAIISYLLKLRTTTQVY